MRGTGANDELDGTQSKSAVRFTAPNQDIPCGIKAVESVTEMKSPYGMDCEVVPSQAKWNRLMLSRLDCEVGEGIFCDGRDIRVMWLIRSLRISGIFEVRIEREHRIVEQLKIYVRTLYNIIKEAEALVLNKYPDIVL
jgi:asparagine synthetase A